MKKLIKSVICTVAAISLASCSSFLDEAPRTSLTDGVAFTSEEALEANVAAIYVQLNKFYGPFNMNHQFNACSRMSIYRGDRGTSGLEFDMVHDLTMYSLSSTSQEFYRGLYVGVNRCNTVLSNLPGSPVGEAYKTKIEGETRFLRALNYFNLVRLYGNVPLLLKNATETEDACVPRAMYNEVYKAILDDLEFAEENMRSRDEQESVNRGASRCYKQAATFVKALVYMQIASYLKSPDDQAFGTQRTGSLKPDFTNCGITSAKQAWELCLKACNDVINSGVYSLEPDYRHLFTWDYAVHPEYYESRERILAFNVTNNSDMENAASGFNYDYPIIKGVPCTQHGGNTGRIRGQRWIWEEWCKKYGGTTREVKGRTPETLESVPMTVWDDCKDPRFYATFVYNKDTDNPTVHYKYYDATTGNLKVVTIYPDSGVGAQGSKNAETGEITYTGFDNNIFFRKYFSATYQGGNSTGDADYYVYRYAEVFLTAAEAAANLGQFTDAVDYVNVILERARKSVDPGQPESEEPKAWEYADYTDEPTLTSAITFEREFELMAEGGTHWMDQHRHGATWLRDWLCLPLNEYIQLPAQHGHYQYAYNGKPLPTDIDVLRKSLFCAYPDYDIRYNTALTYEDQNIFWHSQY